MAQIRMPSSSTTTSTQPPAPEEDNDLGFDSPRATMRGFLYAARAGDWNTAAAHLDLRGRDPEDGPTLARQLKTVLDRKLWVDLDGLSNAPEGDTNDGETSARDLVGTIAMPDGNRVKILVERVAGPGGTRQWKVARVTLQQLPALWEAFGDGVLAEWLPRPFFDHPIPGRPALAVDRARGAAARLGGAGVAADRSRAAPHPRDRAANGDPRR